MSYLYVWDAHVKDHTWSQSQGRAGLLHLTCLQALALCHFYVC
jgi:hypothetical protein